MSLVNDKWEASYEGHNVRVTRSNVSRGFELRIDGEKVAGKMMTLVGVGEATGKMHFDGREIPVKVELSIGNECNVWIDGKWVKMAPAAS